MPSIKIIYSSCLFCNLCFLWKIFYVRGLINEVLELNNLDTDPEELKGLNKQKYYFIRNNVTSNYIKYMDKQFREFKNSDTSGKYSNVNNWIDFQNTVDRSTRKKMYTKALNYAVEEYARNELNINTKPYRDEKTGEISPLS